jgi:hypothetical protein
METFLGAVMAGLVPATSINLAPSLMIGVAGTSPAMTPVCVVIQHDQEPL